MTTYLSAAVSMADNPLLYNILLAALSVATLAFLLFIIIDYKRKDGNDERDRIIMFWETVKKVSRHLGIFILQGGIIVL